jgi:hypothetical protein
MSSIIPRILDPNAWFIRFKCGPGCLKCRGTDPGCKDPPIEEQRREYFTWHHQSKLKYHNMKNNLLALDFIWRVGYMRFCQYGMRTVTLSNKIAALLALRQNRIKKFQAFFSEIPEQFQRHAVNLSGLRLSRDQAKMICVWVEDEFQLVLPMGVRKKMLMTSIALGFLIKRLVPNQDIGLMLMIFRAVFRVSLVRKKNNRKRISDRDFLNGIFPK